MFRRCLERICHDIISAKDELNRLDTLSGDGDCGTTFAAVAQGSIPPPPSQSMSHLAAILAALVSNQLRLEYPQTTLLQLSRIFEQTVGGTTGAVSLPRR